MASKLNGGRRLAGMVFPERFGRGLFRFARAQQTAVSPYQSRLPARRTQPACFHCQRISFDGIERMTRQSNFLLSYLEMSRKTRGDLGGNDLR
jgi:hypothetical protein